jgi:hypothetical protein
MCHLRLLDLDEIRWTAVQKPTTERVRGAPHWHGIASETNLRSMRRTFERRRCGYSGAALANDLQLRGCARAYGGNRDLTPTPGRDDAPPHRAFGQPLSHPPSPLLADGIRGREPLHGRSAFRQLIRSDRVRMGASAGICGSWCERRLWGLGTTSLNKSHPTLGKAPSAEPNLAAHGPAQGRLNLGARRQRGRLVSVSHTGSHAAKSQRLGDASPTCPRAIAWSTRPSRNLGDNTLADASSADKQLIAFHILGQIDTPAAFCASRSTTDELSRKSEALTDNSGILQGRCR